MSGRFTSEKLKILAMGTMFLDHAAAAVIFGCGLDELSPLIGNIGIAMRLVGRMAFPLYAFLLVQGFMWTRNWTRYVGRMAVFALISEIPFNLLVAGEIWYPRAQNTIATLLVGLICMKMLETLETQFGLMVRPGSIFRASGLRSLQDSRIDNKAIRRSLERERCERKNEDIAGGKILGIALAIWAVAAAMFAAELLSGDYGALGVFLIVILFVLRYSPAEQVTAGCAAMVLIYGFSLEVIFSWIAFFFISRYNGERGRHLGLMPYVFYPVHLLVVWLVEALICGILGM